MKENIEINQVTIVYLFFIFLKSLKRISNNYNQFYPVSSKFNVKPPVTRGRKKKQSRSLFILIKKIKEDLK